MKVYGNLEINVLQADNYESLSIVTENDFAEKKIVFFGFSILSGAVVTSFSAHKISLGPHFLILGPFFDVDAHSSH